MGGIDGSPSFVLGEFARRLADIEVDTVAMDHDSYDGGVEVFRVAGFGRYKEDGGKMFYGLTVWREKGKLSVSGYTCGLSEKNGIRELVEMATERFVPHFEFPSWVALALHKFSPFDLFRLREKLEKNGKKGV